jgi:hypothetical protein
MFFSQYFSLELLILVRFSFRALCSVSTILNFITLEVSWCVAKYYCKEQYWAPSVVEHMTEKVSWHFLKENYDTIHE